MVAERKRANATPSGPPSSVRCGSQVRISRLVAAWVRTWTSSPIAIACAASASTSSGPDCGQDAAEQRGGHVAQEDQPRDRGVGVPAEPGHLARPLADRREGAGAAGLVLDHDSGAPGPIAVAIGTTMWWWLAGSSADLPAGEQSVRSTDVGRPAFGHDGGAHRAAQRVAHVGPGDGGPQCRSVRPPMPGTTSAAVRDAGEQRHPGVEAAEDLGVRGVDLVGAAAVKCGQGSDTSGHRRRAAPVHLHHRSSLAATASANSGRPTLITSTARRGVDEDPRSAMLVRDALNCVWLRTTARGSCQQGIVDSGEIGCRAAA